MKIISAYIFKAALQLLVIYCIDNQSLPVYEIEYKVIVIIAEDEK